MRPISGTTRVAGVIGSPVRHSLSPSIHNAAFAACGIDWRYLAFEVAPGEGAAAIRAMRTLGLGGLSVTMPHKADVAAAVDRCTPEAAALTAVNCVVPEGAELVGHNTDGGGFLASLAEEGVTVAGRRVVVLGGGGAARAVVAALAGAGAADVAVVNRTPERARVAAALAGPAGRVAPPGAAAGAELVVNATSVGMGAGQGVPIDPDLLRPGQVVVDLVYEPERTPLLVAAAERGAHPVGGIGMLVHQAALAFRLWTGLDAPLAAMAEAARSALAERQPTSI